MNKDGPALKIRHRSLRGYRREAGGYVVWYEYQVVRGRKIIGRYDTQAQAERAIAEIADAGGPTGRPEGP